MFICQVENSEAPEDRIENIVLLSEEKHLVECDIGPEGDSNNLVVCSNSLIDHFLQITDSLELNNRLNFPAGQAYYFTSKCYVIVTNVANFCVHWRHLDKQLV